MCATVTVAVVTARTSEQTSFDKWRQLRRAFLDRQFQHKLVQGEFGALLACALAEPASHHVNYQLRALSYGTRPPDQILVIDRHETEPHTYLFQDSCSRHPETPIRWGPPMLSAKELALHPTAGMALWGTPRRTDTSFGCADKNTAIALCKTDVLVMLDDCCLPGFGLVEAVADHFARETRPSVMPLQHRKIYLTGEGPAFVTWKLEHTDANWTEQVWHAPVSEARMMRRVLGVWAMPTSIIRDELDGYNTLLDGDRAALDEELMARCDRYLEAHGGSYLFNPSARLYEIDHDMPWKDQPRADWKELCPKEGWRAPHAALREMVPCK